MMAKGWDKESLRHSMARKLGKAPPYRKKKKKISIKLPLTQETKFTGGGFEFNFQPIEDTLTVEETKDGYAAKYLIKDTDPINENPNEWGDESMFLVHYHRDFDVRKKEIITEDDARKWYQGGKIPQEKEYWIFPVDAYIHSGVSLSMAEGFRGRLPQGHEQFDVSSVGLVLVSKKDYKSKKKAEKMAGWVLGSWNQYLSGDIYSTVIEFYDKKKKPIDYDVLGGHYGFKHAKEELKEFEGM